MRLARLSAATTRCRGHPGALDHQEHVPLCPRYDPGGGPLPYLHQTRRVRPPAQLCVRHQQNRPLRNHEPGSLLGSPRRHQKSVAVQRRGKASNSPDFKGSPGRLPDEAGSGFFPGPAGNSTSELALDRSTRCGMYRPDLGERLASAACLGANIERNETCLGIPCWSRRTHFRLDAAGSAGACRDG